jgi:peptide/nickel transport system substrate-binding protein
MERSDDSGTGRSGEFSKLNRRTLLAATGGGALAAFLAACTPTTGQPSNTATGSAAEEKPVKGGHLVEAAVDEIEGLSPTAWGQASLAGQIIPRMFDSLLGYEADGLVPLLAKAVPTVSPDQRSYTFQLRQDAKWSDGQPLTAEDVAFSYKLLYDPAYKEVKSAYRADAERVIQSVEAIDPYTIVMTTKQPYAPFLVQNTQRNIVPKHVFGAMSAAEYNNYNFARKDLVVSGAFKFDEWVKGSHIAVVRNDTYYRGAPNLDRYILKFVPAGQATINQLKTGEVDVSRVFTIDAIPDLQAKPNLTVWPNTEPQVFNLWYNLFPGAKAGPIFTSKAVRQALSHAIDRQGMADTVYFKVGASPSTSYIPKEHWAYKDQSAAFKYDPAQAESLLDADGWKRGSDGIRQKNGMPLKVEILSSTAVAEGPPLAQIVQEGWRSIGVDASVRVIVFASMVAQQTTIRDFDVFQKTSGSWPIDPDSLFAIWTSASANPGGLNGGRYLNPTYDGLIADAVRTTDEAKRKEFYGKAQDILAEDMPAPPLVAFRSFFVFNTRVHNYGVAKAPGRSMYGTKVWLKDVWVSDGK